MKLLHPSDFSEAAEKARVLALDLSERLQGSLHLVHIKEPFNDSGERPYLHFGLGDANIEQKLRERVEEARRLEIQELQNRLAFLTPEGGSHELLWGRPAPELLKMAAHYDLIVMGMHGANPLDAFFVGGVAGRLVRHSPVPVLSVRETSEVQHINRILVATDFGDASKHAWQWCQQLTKAGVKLVAAHVIDMENLKGDIGYSQVVTEALELFAQDKAERQVLREGDPISDLPKIAKEVGADAIAIGLRHHSSVMGLLLGSRADGLLRSSEVPILSIPLLS